MSTLIDRLLQMEQRAAHAHAVAAVAEHLAWRERTQADEAQRMLRQCKVLLALLPDEAALQLIAPKLDADDPAARLGAAAVYSTAAQACARFARCCASRSRGHIPMPRPHDLRSSKLRDRSADGDTDIKPRSPSLAAWSPRRGCIDRFRS